MNKLKFTLSFPFRKGIFPKKSVRFLLDVVGSFLGLFFIVILLLLGRLSMGPINLDFLTSEVEAALKAPQGSLSASIEHTQLVWREWKRPFEIELVNVHLQKDQNPHWLKIEHIGVSLWLHLLVRGEVSLKQLRFYHPQILLEKDEKGEFTLGFGESSPSQEFSLKEIAPLLALGKTSSTLGKLNNLNKITIINAHVFLKDEKEDKTWELPKTTFVLRRQSEGFRVELTLQPQQGSGSLILGFSHQLGSPRADITAHFHHISFNQLIQQKGITLCPPHPEMINVDALLDFFQCWNLPLQGKVHLAFVPETFQIIKGSCDINLGKGELDLSLAKLLPLPITSGNLSFDLSPHTIEIKKASLLSDEMLVDLSGKIDSPASPLFLTKLMDSGQTLTFQGKVEDLFLDHLSALWPQDFAFHAREWLTKNLRKGTLTKAAFSLKGHGSEKGLTIDDLRGTLQGEGVEINYLEGLPPAQNAAAYATFDQKGFDIKILSGKVENVKVKEGRVRISGLDTDKEALHLDVKVEGPLSDVLDIINHKPLEYASYGNIDPKTTKGEGDVALHIAFPLLADLEFKDVKISAKGGFKKITLNRKITEELTAHFTQGDLTLDLTHEQMVIKGQGVLNELPSTLTYEHLFKEGAPYELQLKVETHASFEDFKRLGFDYKDYGQGPTRTSLTYTLEKDQKSHLSMNLDITPSTLSFPPLEWKKNPGEKGALSFVLVFEGGRLSKMKDLKLFSNPYSLKGEIYFDPHKNWKTIQLSEFKGPHTATQVILHTPHQNTYEISFKGHSVDLENFLHYVNGEEIANDHPSTSLKLSAEVDQLRLGEGKVFDSVKAFADLSFQGNDTTWKEVHLRAKAGKGTVNKGDMAQVSGGILFDIKSGPHNTQTLEVRANDAGKFLKNLSIYEDIKRGYITVKAQRQAGESYKGTFKLKQFDAQEVPLLARFAALLSPMGIVNLFSEKKTLSMDRFECDFEFTEDLIRVKQGVGKSLSLGFTAEGKLDRKNRLFDLKGNVIPARFLNSILSNIPLIGSLLNGGEGEGLFAIAYTIKGSFDKPEVSLNPLSALAPGFIRKLFQSLAEDDS